MHAGTLQFLLDIELMNHADYFVGTTNSGLPHIIDVLRYAVSVQSIPPLANWSTRGQKQGANAQRMSGFL